MDKIVYETSQFDIAVTRAGKVSIMGDPVMVGVNTCEKPQKERQRKRPERLPKP